jgi:hypothetical protein
LAQKKPGPIGRRKGTGRVRVEEQTVEGNGPEWRPVVGQVLKGETAPCRSEEGEPWEGSDLNIVLQKAASFL